MVVNNLDQFKLISENLRVLARASPEDKYLLVTDQNIKELLCITTYISYTDRDVINSKLLKKDLADTGTEINNKLKDDKTFRNLISNNLQNKDKLNYLNINNALNLLRLN